MTELYYLHKITPLMHLYHSLLVVLDSQLHKLEEFSPFLQTLLLSCLRISNSHLNKDKKNIDTKCSLSTDFECNLSLTIHLLFFEEIWIGNQRTDVPQYSDDQMLSV